MSRYKVVSIHQERPGNSFHEETAIAVWMQQVLDEHGDEWRLVAVQPFHWGSSHSLTDFLVVLEQR